ncbi:hypothetical protein FB107DRAFT_279590 [Schizophyllum commune]
MDSPPQLSLLATAFDTLLCLSHSSDGLRPRGNGHESLSELREIELRSRSCIPIDPAFLRLLLAPTITEVCQHPTLVPATSWSYIVAALPSLTHLKLRTEDTSAKFCCALVQALGAHPTVQRVSLTFDSASSSTGLLPGLAAYPALHDLRVHVIDTDDDDRRADVPWQGFSALRHLYCIGTSLPFLRLCVFSRPALALSTLSADVRIRATADLHSILSTISAHVDRGHPHAHRSLERALATSRPDRAHHVSPRLAYHGSPDRAYHGSPRLMRAHILERMHIPWTMMKAEGSLIAGALLDGCMPSASPVASRFAAFQLSVASPVASPVASRFSNCRLPLASLCRSPSTFLTSSLILIARAVPPPWSTAVDHEVRLETTTHG